MRSGERNVALSPCTGARGKGRRQELFANRRMWTRLQFRLFLWHCFLTKQPLVQGLKLFNVDNLSCLWKSSSSLPLLGLNQGTSELQPTRKFTQTLIQNKQLNSGLIFHGSDRCNLWMYNHFLRHNYCHSLSVLSLKYLRIAEDYFDKVLRLSYLLVKEHGFRRDKAC